MSVFLCAESFPTCWIVRSNGSRASVNHDFGVHLILMSDVDTNWFCFANGHNVKLLRRHNISSDGVVDCQTAFSDEGQRLGLTVGSDCGFEGRQ